MKYKTLNQINLDLQETAIPYLNFCRDSPHRHYRLLIPLYCLETHKICTDYLPIGT